MADMAQSGGLLGKAAPALSPRHLRLLELMQEQARRDSAVAAGAAPPIPRRPAGEAPVMSFGQRQLWFLEQLQPGTAAYHVPGAVRIRGALDLGRLAGCLREVARRHEVLRTGFEVRDGEPVPVIADLPRLAMPVADLSALPAARREAAAAQAVDRQVSWPFDLRLPPLARTCLVRLAPDEAIFLLVLQHIVSDIWSVGVFFRNAMALYDAAAAGAPRPLPELALQYSDYAAWQQQVLRGESLQALLAYWRGQLADAPLVLDLPADRPRPALQSFTGGRRYMQFTPALTARLKAAARWRDASLYMLLLAALQTLLFRLTGQPTILIGVPMANRRRIELEGLIGLLFNSLAVRGDLAAATPFDELLAQVRERTLGAMQHQDLPFERLVDALQVARDMSRNPIYQVLFAFQNVPPSAMAARGLELSRYEVTEATSREDLELDLRETPQGLAGWFGFDLALFDGATVERFAGHFAALLEAVAHRPERCLGELPLLSPAQEQALRCEWNDTASPLPAADAAALVVAQARRTPDAVAVAEGGRSLSYAELAARAARAAVALAAAGAGRGTLVAVLAQRSTELVTALLGILRAGAAYLPLDPDHPARRHAQALAQGRVPLVVATAGFLPVLAETAALLAAAPRPSAPPRLLALESLAGGAAAPRRAPAASTLAAPSAAAPAATGNALNAGAYAILPADLAYVIFTSGSTGEPKGAAIAHGGMLNHLLGKVAALGLHAGDVVAQTASQCFDISLWQMLAPLASGGRVCIVADLAAHDPARLLEQAEAGQVTVLETVPSLLRLVLGEARRRGAARPPLGALRWLVPTGEALPPELCGDWFALYPRVPMLNAYGPTECSDDVTHQRVAAAPAPGAALRVPIGRPLPNTHLAVVDSELRELPAGVAGELVVGGAGVGRGYLHDPVRTALAFVPDPFATGAAPDATAFGARLYRTGDRARRLADGSLDFLGRLDHQVKLRGFRVELGEIEAALGQLPGIAAAAVLAQDETLVAHLAARHAEPAGEAAAADAAEQAALERAAIAHLQDRLPEYMVPAVFVWHPRLPLTANGKLDRRALAAAPVGAAPHDTHVAPRNEIEETLAAIWSEVLKRPEIGVYDDFFASGGQSLLATQVVTRVREAFGVDLPVRTLFQTPTVAGLAESLQAVVLRGHRLPPAPAMTRIAAAERGGPLPPSFGQERFWFIDQLRPGLTAYNIFGAVRMRGRLDRTLLAACFDELARRHEVLRTTFVAVDGRPMQVVGPPRGLPIPQVDLAALPSARRDRLAARLKDEEAQRPFDLARGPLIRGVLLSVGAGDHILAVTAHHVVYDVWSRELLIRELAALYTAFWHHRPSPLPELPVQYADFARWQRGWLDGEVLATQLDYWKRQLAGVTTGSELPGDRPRPPVQSFRGRRQTLTLPAALTAGLKELSRHHGVTLFMTLLAGFDMFLYRYIGEDDVVVGSPIANRNRAETENLIGFFVNTQVLRSDLAGDPGLRRVSGRVRETALAAHAHQDLAFEQLVGDLRPSRDPARQPLFQILFNFLTNYQPIELALPELTLTPEANHSGAVQFDLIVSIYEAAGELHISADHSTDLYDGATVQRMLRHYRALLAEGAAAPDAPLSALDLAAPAERQQLLVEWSGAAEGALAGPAGAAAGAPAGDLAHAWIAARAAAHPAAPAVRCDGHLLTYGELDRRANRMARRLRRLGAGADVVVALLAERGLDLVSAVLAIWKAGGAYLPLDPRHPAERLRQVVEQSGTRLVLVERTFAQALGEPLMTQVAQGTVRLAVLDELLAPAGQPDEDEELPPAALAGHLAYVIYTSGSTGVPKGAMVEHRGMANHLRGKIAALGLGPADVVAQNASHTFDISVWQMFAALAVGGRVQIFRDAIAHDPQRLLAEVAHHGITVFETVPSLLALMLAEAPAASPGIEVPAAPALRLPALRWLVPTGEALAPELCRRWAAAWPQVPLLNAYGPTECSDDVTHERLLDAAAAARLPRVAIGRPLPGVRLTVVDAGLRPVPLGVPGELCVGGVAVGRGYLGDPERTAEAFIPEPAGAPAGARAYRTRDLVRHRADGALEYLGRLDHQVKVRGARIELGEIEAALLRHAAVREAAVLVKRNQVGDPRLVAYVVAADPELAADPARLRVFLGQLLPDVMQPSAYVALASMPRGASGKLDRRALDALVVPELALQTPFVAPRTPVEERLAAIWSELLGVERVGALDNFFDLGGHSLLTTQLLSRLRAAFGLAVPLPAFFEDPTISGLAQAIELARWAEDVALEAAAGGIPPGRQGGAEDRQEGEL